MKPLSLSLTILIRFVFSFSLPVLRDVITSSIICTLPSVIQSTLLVNLITIVPLTWSPVQLCLTKSSNLLALLMNIHTGKCLFVATVLRSTVTQLSSFTIFSLFLLNLVPPRAQTYSIRVYRSQDCSLYVAV